MDNQQGKVNESNINWFSGLFDGEGCIDFQQSKSAYYKKKDRQGLDVYYYPRARICMTHAETLPRVVKILEENSVAHHVSWRKPSVVGRKTSWTVEIIGLKRVKHFILTVVPYLTTKRQDAETMFDFILMRESHHQHDGYSQKELSLIEKLRNR